MNTTANLGKAPVRTLVLQLAIPSMTAQFVNVLYSIIDRMYIGHISENGALALAGAGICGPIVTLLTSFGTLVGIGGSITMGIRMGEKNHKKAEQVLANSFLMLSVFSVLLTVSFLLLKDKLLMLFGASGATFPFANTYLTIYTTGTFFALMATVWAIIIFRLKRGGITASASTERNLTREGPLQNSFLQRRPMPDLTMPDRYLT